MKELRIANNSLKLLCFVVALGIISVLNEGKVTSLAFSSNPTNAASSARSTDGSRRNRSILSVQSTPSTDFHTVQGILCREVVNELPVIGKIVVLEATAESQEELVDECLELEDEITEDGKQRRISEGDPYGCVCHKLKRQIIYSLIRSCTYTSKNTNVWVYLSFCSFSFSHIRIQFLASSIELCCGLRHGRCRIICYRNPICETTFLPYPYSNWAPVRVSSPSPPQWAVVRTFLLLTTNQLLWS